MGDNFLVSGLIVKYVSVNYIKTFQFKMFYHVISTVKMLYSGPLRAMGTVRDFPWSWSVQPGVPELKSIRAKDSELKVNSRNR